MIEFSKSNHHTAHHPYVDGNRGRILLVINGTDFGGTETALFQIAVGLDRRGYDVHVLTLKSPGRTAARLRRHGIPVSSLGMTENVEPWSMLLESWRLRRWLLGNHFDLIYSFLPRANIMSRIANRFAGRLPHISSEHSTDFLRSRTVTGLNRLTARWTDEILAVSPPVRRVLIEREGIDPEKIRMLGNGVDLEAIDAIPPTPIRDELGLEPGCFLFCTAARLIRDKGHVYLFQAVRRIVEHGADVHLLLIGEGPEEANLRKQSMEPGLSQRVHLLGFRGDVVGILKAADAFVLPSLEEGIPVVLLEAMACSLPCIATAVGGIPDVLGDEMADCLVPPAERWAPGATAGGARAPAPAHAPRHEEAAVEDLSRAMEGILADERRRANLARMTRKRVDTMFSMDAILSQLEEIYAEATEAGP